MNSEHRSSSGLQLKGAALPVSAEQIEKRLSEIWQELSSDHPDQFPGIKLCLANLVVITDPLNGPQAEKLAAEVAAMHPSRIIVIVTEESRSAYSAVVSTSCSRDADTGAIRCWEIIQILTDSEHVEDIPGAVRSLLIDSVPVISVDFRPFQTTPAFDRTILELSDYQIVNAEVVPSRVSRQISVSLRWFWTLPLRELLADMFSSITSSGESSKVSAVTFYTRPDRDSYDDLMSGWILHRLQGGTVLVTDGEYIVDCPGHCVRLRWTEARDDSDRLLDLSLDNGTSAEIRVHVTEDCSDVAYGGACGNLRLSKQLSSYAMSRYLIGILQDDSEVEEYLVACRTARHIVQPAFR
jgi:glucose-6-phosphate dehydrogenase assembly protein OpcA